MVNKIMYLQIINLGFLLNGLLSTSVSNIYTAMYNTEAKSSIFLNFF